MHRDGHSARPGREPRVRAYALRCPVLRGRFGLDAGNRYAVDAHPVPDTLSTGTRGRSSMAELQPSKLVMRVRFPSPAPMYKPRSEGTRTVVAILWRSVSVAGRARHVPLGPLGAAFDESPGAHVVSHNVIRYLA